MVKVLKKIATLSSTFIMTLWLSVITPPFIHATEPPKPIWQLNPRLSDDCATLIQNIKQEIDQTLAELKSQKELQKTLIDWLKLNYDEYVSTVTDQNTLAIIAEATFWCVKCDLDAYFESMTFKQIRNLDFNEIATSDHAFRHLFHLAACKLIFPTWDYEKGFALREAAWAIYIKKHGLSKKKLEEIEYIWPKPLSKL
jgi:hypothetical protein